MIKVYHAYSSILEGINPYLFTRQLSPIVKSKLEALKREEDKKLLITSSILLSHVLSENSSEFKISDLLYNKEGRPFFPGSPFDLNISHTEGCVAIAYSEKCRVGIDIERIADICLTDFEHIFPKQEWEKINASQDKRVTFYNYWTLLESALKADGRGLPLVSENSIEITDDQVMIDGTLWFCCHIDFDPSISCCIASNRKIEAVKSDLLQLI